MAEHYRALEGPTEPCEDMAAVFRPGALVKYTGQGCFAITDHKRLVDSDFVSIDKGTVMLYVDTIGVNVAAYVLEDEEGVSINSYLINKHSMLKRVIELTASRTMTAGAEQTVFHRFLVGDQVVRFNDTSTNLHQDFHYAKPE